MRSAARVKTDPATLELFARSLVDTDEVVIEATANGLAIARINEPHVQRVVLANPRECARARDARRPTGLMPGCWRSCRLSGFWMTSGHRMRRPEHGGG